MDFFPLSLLLKRFNLNKFRSLLNGNIHSIQTTIFGQIRASGEKKPIVVFGTVRESVLLRHPLARFFRDRPTEYAYIELPVNLYKLLKKIQRMKSLRDELAVKRHIKRYADKKAILNIYLHDLNNAINNKDLQKTKEILKTIEIFFEDNVEIMNYLRKSYNNVSNIKMLKEMQKFFKTKQVLS